MPRKLITDSRQLTLFDGGLDAPPEVVPPAPSLTQARSIDIRGPVEAEIVPAEPPPVAALAATEPLQEARAQDLEPTLFEKANYDRYQALKAEAGAYTRMGAILLVGLFFVAVLRVQPQEALLSIFKFTGVPFAYVIGVFGWATTVYMCFGLYSEAKAEMQKRRCGPFYQRVLRFSDSEIATCISRSLSAAYIISVLGAIGITWVVAGSEMLKLAADIVIGILNMFRIGPWETTGP
jgi:hypothetical protein